MTTSRKSFAADAGIEGPELIFEVTQALYSELEKNDLIELFQAEAFDALGPFDENIKRATDPDDVPPVEFRIFKPEIPGLRREKEFRFVVAFHVGEGIYYVYKDEL